MLNVTLVGKLGTDAQKQSKDGRNFTTFRVAHNDDWTDQAGQRHSSVIWVDCIMNDHPKVADYLKQGTLVCVTGSVKLRVFSSEKERCMKAGMQINVQRIELLGGSSDDVPRRLYDKDGVQHDVKKYYLTDVKDAVLVSQHGQRFTVDNKGWCRPDATQPSDAADSSSSSDDNVDRSGDGAPTF